MVFRGAAAAALLALTAGAAPGLARADPLAGCRVAGLSQQVLCGALQRPLDPARPAGPQITVHYVVVPAMARRKLPDPVFLLAGGPGQSAAALAPTFSALLGRLNNRRDLVFVDQRGTGRSAPLDCPDARRAPLTDAADPEQQVARLARCRERLAALPHVGGADGLRHYTTWIAMQDLDAVRRALGAARINLVAASYGTRAALDYMRQFPQTVRRSVLDGVVPPDMVLPASFAADALAALDAALDGCAREAACAAAYPGLRADWEALLRSLPKDVVVADPTSGAPETLRLTREVLFGMVRGPLYVPALTAGLPAAIDSAARGRFEPLAGLAALFASRRALQVSMGMHFSVVCAEDLPLLEREPPVAGPAAGFVRLYQRVCADWPRGAVPAAFYTVPRNAAPVLLLSGGADPATPPRHGARMAAALGPEAQHVVVPNAGHGLAGVGCMREVIFRFIDAASDAEAAAVDAGCMGALPRPPAFLPPAVAAPQDPAAAPREPR